MNTVFLFEDADETGAVKSPEPCRSAWRWSKSFNIWLITLKRLLHNFSIPIQLLLLKLSR